MTTFIIVLTTVLFLSVDCATDHQLCIQTPDSAISRKTADGQLRSTAVFSSVGGK